MDNNFSNLLMDECPPDLRSPEDEAKPTVKKSLSRGATTSFGFRKLRPQNTQNENTQHIIAADAVGLDSNGNTGTDKAASGRLGVIHHRLPPPKKEAKATTKVSRFGFRQANANRLNRVADANINPPTRMHYTSSSSSNNNTANDSKEREKIENEIKAKVEMQERQLAAATDSNRNRHVAKFTLQSNQLPKPVPIKFLESKHAKTMANNNRKRFVSATSTASTTGTSGDESSTTLTEDSGVELNVAKPRTFDVALTANNRFEARDRLPASLISGLPTVRATSAQATRSNFGFVRNRAMDYQENVIAKREQQQYTKKTSPVSADVDKSYKRNEKIAQFIKQKPSSQQDVSSSDEQIWPSHAGEAMADISTESAITSEKSAGNVSVPRLIATVESQITAKARNRLSLVDPKFAAIAAASNISSSLIEDEPSPVESITGSYSEGNSVNNDKVKQSSATNEKEKNTASTSSPGSPTNVSNSLSLTDDRDDFLIDDEIADQPALLCDETITSNTQVSEVTVTPVTTAIVSTPKTGRRHLSAMLVGSPLSIRNKALLLARATSVDTLSPCESIASDDCMMDYDLSSGVEDLNDKTETNQCKFNDFQVQVQCIDKNVTDIMMRDWSSLIASAELARSTPKRLSLRTPRHLKSREATPSSSVPDSPRSDRANKKSSRTSLHASSRSSGTGYESDDSVVRIDRSQHYAMQQDVMGIKTLLLKLKRVLHESSTEDYLLTSETHNSLADNGFFGGFNSDSERDGCSNEELINLRRQVEYLQGQLEDTERLTQRLREELTILRASESAPASVTLSAVGTDKFPTHTCNAATQTERVRPFSAGPTLLQGTAHANENSGSLVSSNDSTRSTSANLSGHYNGAKSTGSSPVKLWRMPGEPATPSAIPRRSCSRSRISSSNHLTTSSTSPVI